MTGGPCPVSPVYWLYLVIISEGGADVDSWRGGGGAALCNMKMSESVRILIDRTDNGEDVTRAERRVLRAWHAWLSRGRVTHRVSCCHVTSRIVRNVSGLALLCDYAVTSGARLWRKYGLASHKNCSLNAVLGKIEQTKKLRSCLVISLSTPDNDNTGEWSPGPSCLMPASWLSDLLWSPSAWLLANCLSPHLPLHGDLGTVMWGRRG